MKEDLEKIIKYKMYLESEKIRLAKVEIRELKVTLGMYEDDEELSEIIKNRIYQVGQKIDISKLQLRSLGEQLDNFQNNYKARARNKTYYRYQKI